MFILDNNLSFFDTALRYASISHHNIRDPSDFYARRRIPMNSRPVHLKPPRVLSRYALGISVLGGVFGLLFLLGAGMSDNNDSAKHMTIFALILPLVGLILSLNALIVAHRSGRFGRLGAMSFISLIISTAMLLLTFAALSTYK